MYEKTQIYKSKIDRILNQQTSGYLPDVEEANENEGNAFDNEFVTDDKFGYGNRLSSILASSNQDTGGSSRQSPNL